MHFFDKLSNAILIDWCGEWQASHYGIEQYGAPVSRRPREKPHHPVLMRKYAAIYMQRSGRAWGVGRTDRKHPCFPSLHGPQITVPLRSLHSPAVSWCLFFMSSDPMGSIFKCNFDKKHREGNQCSFIVIILQVLVSFLYHLNVGFQLSVFPWNINQNKGEPQCIMLTLNDGAVFFRIESKKATGTRRLRTLVAPLCVRFPAPHNKVDYDKTQRGAWFVLAVVIVNLPG